MQYIQCKDRADVEKTLRKGHGGFVSADHRIYSSLEFWDDGCSWEMTSQEFLEVSDLLSQIRMMGDGRLEMSFGDILHHAKELEICFDKIVQTLKVKVKE